MCWWYDMRVWSCMGTQGCPQSTLSLCGTHCLLHNDYDLGTYHIIQGLRVKVV